ncbi:MAG: exopolysaccharide biosynthesis protein [Alphaproteobacteria bacterium]|nr:exopolysaccharide biosynthesis protein [Alphaproteobacteria bacterium]
MNERPGVAPEDERTSALLARLARDMPSERMPFGALVEALGDRGFAIVLLVLAAPNALPIPSPPGLSTVFGLPLAFFSAQMMLGRLVPWLPERLMRRTIARADFRAVVTKIAPWLERLERYCRPRGHALTGRRAERILGGFYVLLAMILALPIPGGNFPPGLAMTVMSLGLLEKDGRMVAIGAAIGIAAVVVVAVIVVVSFHLLVEAAHWLLG